eukprot:CAMPEP_0174730710 /NCGR_PEP_ID=MMETSP1094-20130205/56148_1 /TAXON_ID=156173 /ORGANISM="Chrysochromulina brevifilum, Strain UTEX LB 985" /LENGTH=149 /DNA_ID=CAMNT_0015932999 /DNA_START=370 /DNA_END=816 /DNA_ORIENTATION=+
MPSSVAAHLRRRPPCLSEQTVARLPYLDAEGVGDWLAIAAACGGHIALRTRRRRYEQVRLCEELEVIARGHGRWLRKVLVCILGEASAHEDVEYVVHVHLVQAVAKCLPRQVGVAARVCVLPCEQMVGVRIAAGANDVVDPCACTRTQK